MHLNRRKLVEAVLLAAVFALTAGLPAGALAQTYPTKPIRIVMPFSTGGGTDLVMRLLSVPLSQALGQPVIVDNRPGAEGTIAGQTVMNAAADGYTLLAGVSSTLAAVPATRVHPPYDAVTDFTPISFIGRFTIFAFVHPSVPAKTMAELVGYATANPGKLNFGASNQYSIVVNAQLKSLTGMDMLPVPYKGDGQATTELMAGRVHFGILNAMPGAKLTKDGRLRALAVLLPRRSSLLPDVPTMGEAGFPKAEIAPWMGLFGPAKLPREIVERLAKEMNAVLQRADVKEQLEVQAFQAEGTTPEELAAFVKQQSEFYRRAVREAGIQPQ